MEIDHHTLSSKTRVLVFITAGLSALARAAAQAPALPAATGFDLRTLSFPTAPTDLSLTIREGYDTNLFGTESAPLPGRPNIANVASWTTIVSPRVAFNLLPWLSSGPGGFLKIANFSYTAEEDLYSGYSTEDNFRNTFALRLKGAEGPWSFETDNALLWVDGPKDDPFYATYSPLGYRSARDRRNQIQEKNASVLRYDRGPWFADAAANALYYNLLINEHNPVGTYKGYLNWVNRDDINVGTDFGYELTRDFDLVASWRLGQQTQARTVYSPTDSDSTYNRALFGFQGKPLSWLSLQFAAGPDWRRYGDGSNSGLTGQRHTWLYTESSVTAALSHSDSLTFSNKVWHWVSASGATSYQETTDTWNYRHAFSAAFSGSLGFVVQGVRYDAPTVRNDWSTSAPLDLAYAFNRSVLLSVDFIAVRGRSKFPPAVAPGQDWDEKQVFLTLRVVR